MDIITAILIDGGFYQRRAQSLFGEKTPEERVDELMRYIRHHLKKDDHLYRVFYYDCPPSRDRVYHPLLKRQIDLSKTSEYQWMTQFHSLLMNQRKVALRLGELSLNKTGYILDSQVTKKLLAGTKQLSELTERDFRLSIEQKGVDMRIGIDIASMAYKKQVNRMVLISGDSDFIPAAKLARREGVDFVLDSMGAAIKESLNKHIDGLTTHIKSVKTN